MLLFCVVAFGAILRFVPHPPNFSAVTAMALFGGAYFKKRYALIVPLAVIFLSDFFIGFYSWKLMTAVYGSFMVSGLIGTWLKTREKVQFIAFASIVSSIFFFVVTNFAVWAFSPWYEKSVSGLLQCYFMALPFLKNSLLGDLFYTTVFFGTYELAIIWVKKRFKTKENNAVLV